MVMVASGKTNPTYLLLRVCQALPFLCYAHCNILGLHIFEVAVGSPVQHVEQVCRTRPLDLPIVTEKTKRCVLDLVESAACCIGLSDLERRVLFDPCVISCRIGSFVGFCLGSNTLNRTLSAIVQGWVDQSRTYLTLCRADRLCKLGTLRDEVWALDATSLYLFGNRRNGEIPRVLYKFLGGFQRCLLELLDQFLRLLGFLGFFLLLCQPLARLRLRLRLSLSCRAALLRGLLLASLGFRLCCLGRFVGGTCSREGVD